MVPCEKPLHRQDKSKRQSSDINPTAGRPYKPNIPTCISHNNASTTDLILINNEVKMKTQSIISSAPAICQHCHNTAGQKPDLEVIYHETLNEG
jgi:hypothetical protein